MVHFTVKIVSLDVDFFQTESVYILKRQIIHKSLKTHERPIG